MVHREKGELEKGIEGEGSLQYVGSGGYNTRRKDLEWGGGFIFGKERGTSEGK